MATLSSAFSLHRDIRGENRSYKRDKEHAAKWALGVRPSSGVKIRFDSGWEPYTGSEEQRAKVRPYKGSHTSDKARGNSFNPWNFGSAANRVVRKQDALKEASSTYPLSKSLSDLAPSSSTSRRVRAPSIDAGVLYSFDTTTTPRKGVVLDSLVEKAEREWNSRETEKIVRGEYEVLDSSGEISWIPKGKGKRGIPFQHAKSVVAQDDDVDDDDDDDDDWEAI